MAKNTSTRNKERREEALRDLDRELRVRDRAEKSKPLGVAAASVLVIVAIVGGIWWAANQNGDDKNTDQQAQNSTSATPDPAANTQPLATARTNPLPETVNCTYTPEGQAAREVSVPPAENIPATGTVTVTLNTNAGPIGMTLDRAVSPCTVNAVQHLAASTFYNDTICHRMTSEGIHVLQCGDPSGSGSGGPGFKFPNEYPTDEAGGNATQPVNYKRGTIAMANSGPDTNGSQFFLNYGDSPLAPQYTYFGQINEAGLATLDSIAGKGIKDGAGDGAPAEEVKIESATVS